MSSTGASSLHEVGKRLLQTDIHEEPLDELLRSLWTNDASLKLSRNPNLVPSTFGIPPLDKLIPQSKPKSSAPVVELTSISDGAGRTHLVYLAVALAVLPSVHHAPARTDPGDPACKQGKSGLALVIDADDCFEVERLADIMRNLWNSMIEGASSADRQTTAGADPENSDARSNQPRRSVISDAASSVDAVIENALQHVHVLRPQSLGSLVATVNSLPGYLFDSTQHFSNGRAVELVAIDSLSAFYWQEKLEQETSATAASQGIRKYDDLVRSLRQVQDIFHCPILATSWGLQPVSGPQPHRSILRGSRPSFKPLLSPSWLSFCTLRLAVARESVKPFHIDMTLEQTEIDRNARHEVVERGRFVAWVDNLGFGADGKVGEFEFWIRDEGVNLEGL
ncbi:MAG: hypothetical protein M1831_005622 [Alyxoria varia]|nr:MAG: hypothetical protein M1831_005622 [Alyxoria varia]